LGGGPVLSTSWVHVMVWHVALSVASGHSPRWVSCRGRRLLLHAVHLNQRRLLLQSYLLLVNGMRMLCMCHETLPVGVLALHALEVTLGHGWLLMRHCIRCATL
jgi:hypothetical protein